MCRPFLTLFSRGHPVKSAIKMLEMKMEEIIILTKIPLFNFEVIFVGKRILEMRMETEEMPYSTQWQCMANISSERAVQKLILFPEIIFNFEVF